LVTHLVEEAKAAEDKADTYLIAFLTLAGVNGFCFVLLLAAALYRLLEWCFDPQARQEKTELIKTEPAAEETTVAPRERGKRGTRKQKARVAADSDEDEVQTV
jgi:hypothetical protein